MSAGQVFSMSALVVSAFLAVEGGVFGQDAALPPGVKAVWDMSKAHRDTTPTREQVCINGLWRWQPARDTAGPIPAGDWGYFKVPGFWPGLANSQLEDCQTCFAHPVWKDMKLGGISAAWYQREITIPAAWTGRRIALSAEYVNSLAIVYVDGAKVGQIRFPGGEVDLTAQCRPRRRAHAQPARHCHAAESRHDVQLGHGRAQGSRGQRGTARPVRRRLAGRRAGGAAHRRT